MYTPEPATFTIAEFSKSFRVGRTFIYEQIKQGHLKAVKAGAKTLILRFDAERWANALPALITAKGNETKTASPRMAA